MIICSQNEHLLLYNHFDSPGIVPMSIFTSAPLLGSGLCQIVPHIEIAELDDNTFIDDLISDAFRLH